MTRIVLTLAWLGACQPKVSPDQLSDVPSERVDELEATQRELRATTDRLAERKAEQERFATREDQAEDRVDHLEDAREMARDERADAVDAGLRGVAEAEAETIEAVDEALDEVEPSLDSAADRAAELALEVAFLEARRDWLEATLEVQRAEGALAGGADLDLAPFVAAEDRAFEDLGEAYDAWLASLEEDEKVLAEVDRPRRERAR